MVYAAVLLTVVYHIAYITRFICKHLYREWISLRCQWHKAAETCSQSLEIKRLFCWRAVTDILLPSAALCRQHRTSQVCKFCTVGLLHIVHSSSFSHHCLSL